ncbi:NAD(P)-binding protein [Microthyrium microscopicum]|uniref:NAD(P)-binding protein n=1 Tax=Microthyrium microscopicum TaxID=703497 RepID=A0A6A6U5G9_9PEZI|nr:NAD(P)-binding protein [Microthyrium microscopicum]
MSVPANINDIPYDAPLSIPRASRSFILTQNRKGADRTHITLPPVDLRNKWILISGSNNGIGREAAIQFAAWGANLVLAARKPPPTETSPEQVVDECLAAARKAGHEDVSVEWWEVDYTKLSSVEELAQRWLDTGRALDVLCNNAGIGSSPGGGSVWKTEDGFEIIHQVNLLAHVLLTLRLLPSLAKAAEPRVVCTTSCFHFLGTFDLRNTNGELGKTGSEGVNYYQNNKLWFQVWLTELQRRLLLSKEYQHITVNGVHPGYVNSGIWNLNTVGGWFTRIKTWVVKMMAYYFGINEQQGSLAILHGATGLKSGPDPELQGVGEKGGLGGGRYFSRTTELEAMPHARDPDCRQRVWRKVNDELKLEDKGLLNVLGLKYEERSKL